MATRKRRTVKTTFAERLFKAHLAQLNRHYRQNGIKGLERLYKEARADLYQQLLEAGGPTSKTPTATQLKTMIAQADAILSLFGKRIFEHLKDIGSTTAELGISHGIEEYSKLEKHFTGTTPVLPIDKAAAQRGLVRDLNSSLLKRYQLVSKTWTSQTIQNVEQALSLGTLTQKPMEKIIDDVMGKTGVMSDERYKAERIVRTETANAHNASKFQAMQRTKEDLEVPLHKKLIETIDDRTGDDSFIIHGQSVPIDQPFAYKYKKRGVWVVKQYMYPPNRPNDRAVVIPWDPEWPETDREKPWTKGELRKAPPTRWRDTVGVEIPPGHVPGEPAR